MNQCSVCLHPEDDSDYELRPYGPMGALICFDCMQSTPARRAEAARQFKVRLAVAEEKTGVAAIGPKGGPQPFTGELPDE